ncbi:enoyl-CoA hydratase/isomerase family protein [Burkholderia pseudomallei]|uniref:3-hydroxyacyl-CoA dehydrogenase NAD-binding domain-containing protein n=1 Tax=Burkholderia pseudomallei TaxID=28450 RepID=UPI001AD7C5FB|nr:3-hydroxyacyl-CoA dehydrogenase NAD-binding domain-containing protein [Burkholderia pseudomallei]MBO7934032.1 enoyl-CoA hydratase/isomerase family protein [Burkholderia pseudomallei]
MIDYSVDGDGVAQIIWNDPAAAVNVLNEPAMKAFVAAVDQAVADEAVKGAIISSAKRDFLAGGDLGSLYAAGEPAQAIANVAGIKACLRRMERCGKPFVALLNGSALGGGLEVALACHRRLVIDDSRVRLGLPEVSLGLIPGSGGTQRLPRLIGIAPAAKMMLEGKPVDAARAKALGLVDDVLPVGESLEAARKWIIEHPQIQQPWDRKHFRYPDFEPQSHEGRWFFYYSWPQLRRKSPAGDLAPGALLHVLAQGLERGIDAGLSIEERYFGMVAASPSARNRIRTQFFAAGAARKQKSRPADEPPFVANCVGVVGAGQMGGGIALVSALAGFDTILLDSTDAISAQGKERIAKTLEGRVARKQLSEQQASEVLARIRTGSDYAALRDAELVIEAVVELPDVKAQVFARIADAVGNDAIIASNTSTLSITRLAADVPRPGNFIGLHFFAPVDRMALVEVILGARTSARTHAHALDFLKRISKTAVTVNDGPGFYTSRVVAAYTREALTMLAEGVAPALIDNAAFTAGLPIGPLAMADLTSYELLGDIIRSLAVNPRGTAVDSQMAHDAAHRLVAAGRSGRRGVGGVYEYHGNSKSVWPGLCEVFPLSAQQPDVDEVVQRLLNIQSLEAIHAMDEGVIDDPLSVDLAAVLGWGYPGWRGGVLAHVDDVGAAAFVRQCDALADRYGERFRSPASLRQRAQIGERFHVQ